MQFIDNKTIKLDKEINELDKTSMDFCNILKKYTKYVIVSGYVAILFGRSRTTEDVDIFIAKLDKDKFNEMFDEFAKSGFECMTADNDGAFENLSEDIPVRFCKGNQFVPNFELKFAKKPLDIRSLDDNLTVIVSIGEFRVSFIEQQIAFKEVCLGSDKDLEDAAHLRGAFKGRIDQSKLEFYKKIFCEKDVFR